MVGHLRRKGMCRINQQINLLFPYVVYQSLGTTKAANAHPTGRCHRLANAPC